MFRNAYFCVLFCVLFSTVTYGQDWKVIFDPPSLIVHMETEETTQLSIAYVKGSSTADKLSFHLRSEDPEIATVNKTIEESDFIEENGIEKWTGNFTISAILVSRIKIYVELETSELESTVQRSESKLALTVTRNNRPFDYILFIYAGVSITILYIKIGAEFDFEKIKLLFKDSKSSLYGLVAQFTIMPIVGYLVGYLFFSDIIGLHLGFFFTPVCPIGAASHIWLQLKVVAADKTKLDTVTTISTLVIFVTIPLWLLTLGKVIFDHGNIKIPNDRIICLVAALIVTFLTGVIMQKFLPKIPQYLEKLGKPKSVTNFIILLGYFANFYIFKIHTWMIILAGCVLIFISYIIGFVIAIFLPNRSKDKVLFVSDYVACILEIGMLNTGLAIFFLKFCLSQPEADQALTAALLVTLCSAFMALIFVFGYCFLICKTDYNIEPVISSNDPDKLPRFKTIDTTTKDIKENNQSTNDVVDAS